MTLRPHSHEYLCSLFNNTCSSRRSFENNTISSANKSKMIHHLISSQSLNLGSRRGTTDDVATIPSHPSLSPLPSGNLQTPFQSIPWCYHPISSSVFLSFLLLSLSPAELSSPWQRILRCSHTIWVSVSLPWLGDHPELQLHVLFCCKPPRLPHGLCRKCSEVSYSISSQGLDPSVDFWCQGPAFTCIKECG